MHTGICIRICIKYICICQSVRPSRERPQVLASTVTNPTTNAQKSRHECSAGGNKHSLRGSEEAKTILETYISKLCLAYNSSADGKPPNFPNCLGPRAAQRNNLVQNRQCFAVTTPPTEQVPWRQSAKSPARGGSGRPEGGILLPPGCHASPDGKQLPRDRERRIVSVAR